jgi:hypothetical protein
VALRQYELLADINKIYINFNIDTAYISFNIRSLGVYPLCLSKNDARFNFLTINIE